MYKVIHRLQCFQMWLFISSAAVDNISNDTFIARSLCDSWARLFVRVLARIEFNGCLHFVRLHCVCMSVCAHCPNVTICSHVTCDWTLARSSSDHMHCVLRSDVMFSHRLMVSKTPSSSPESSTEAKLLWTVAAVGQSACVTGVRILGHFARIPFHFCSRLPNIKIPQLLAAGKLKGWQTLMIDHVCS